MTQRPEDEPFSFSNLPGASADDDAYLQSAGLRRNAQRHFKVELVGLEFYSLLGTLEKAAEKSDKYTNIRAFVIWTEKIREQLRAQGFYREP